MSTLPASLGPQLPDAIRAAASAGELPGGNELWIAAGAALGVIVVAWVIVTRRRLDHAAAGPTYRRLCKLLELPARDRRMLWRLGLRAGMPCPASMFVSRGCFDRAIALLPPARRHHRERLVGVRRQIFGT